MGAGVGRRETPNALSCGHPAPPPLPLPLRPLQHFRTPFQQPPLRPSLLLLCGGCGTRAIVGWSVVDNHTPKRFYRRDCGMPSTRSPFISYLRRVFFNFYRARPSTTPHFHFHHRLYPPLHNKISERRRRWPPTIFHIALPCSISDEHN